eukprot:TRINITY_DN8373_c0_g1_i1.p3 TRINITY_DN8373_c0_g1~~TRINITY_DN8373_c0_g1_i1.p3  ORF type:complete len:148 (+),score=33.53 TRINITY_DN8373_c0_g1_i1:47-445(+)
MITIPSENTMSVRELTARPDSLAHFPDQGKYRWLELHDKAGVYGHCAIGEREDLLELHITLTRWGGGIRRNLVQDVAWLKEEARRLGKARILGIRADDKGGFDARLFKFAHLFGFTEMCVFQTATLHVDARA